LRKIVVGLKILEENNGLNVVYWFRWEKSLELFLKE